jgi:7-cyano-7-deazaguanine synthase in queuosine biosynthesis
MKNVNKKKIAILFSGGLDSTYLVYKNLLEGNTVQPIYVDIINNKTKVEREKEAIGKMMTIFGNTFGDILHNVKYNVTINITGSSENVTPIQMPIWMFGAIMSLSDYDELHIGYVMGDQAMSYMDDVKNLWKAYLPFVYNGKLPEIKFPLSKKYKAEMWESLPDDIRQLTVFCENTTYDGNDCGRCDTCKRSKYDDVFHRYNRNKEKKVDIEAECIHDIGEETNNEPLLVRINDDDILKDNDNSDISKPSFEIPSSGKFVVSYGTCVNDNDLCELLEILSEYKYTKLGKIYSKTGSIFINTINKTYQYLLHIPHNQHIITINMKNIILNMINH